jgi:hypothetical protein
MEVIRLENLSKLYDHGQVGTGTVSKDNMKAAYLILLSLQATKGLWGKSFWPLNPT